VCPSYPLHTAPLCLVCLPFMLTSKDAHAGCVCARACVCLCVCVCKCKCSCSKWVDAGGAGCQRQASPDVKSNGHKQAISFRPQLALAFSPASGPVPQDWGLQPCQGSSGSSWWQSRACPCKEGCSSWAASLSASSPPLLSPSSLQMQGSQVAVSAQLCVSCIYSCLLCKRSW